MRTTLIGSVPHKEPKVAVEKIFENVSIPCWPQLPKRSFKEHMCPQYSENFPGVQIVENEGKLLLNEEEFNLELENFYQNYLNKNLEFFKITPEYASGFYSFVNQLNFIKLKEIKLQTTGPITFGFTVKTPQGQAVFYNEQYREVLEKHLIMKSIWQMKTIMGTASVKSIILFYDEPYLAAYGSAFTAVSKEEIINTLESTLSETKSLTKEVFLDKIELKVGIHCCANTDWSILTSLESLDIISFDAYEFFENFLLYSKELNKFLQKGGKVAWGIIPNSEKILNESYDSLIKKLNSIFEQLIDKGITLSRDSIEEEIITPQCGLGGAKEEILEKVLKICSEFNKTKKL